MPDKELTAVSLFSGGGIGDLSMRAAGIRLLVANELLDDRASVLKQNFPEAAIIPGDIAEVMQTLSHVTRDRLKGRVLDVLFATPPCQGMSKNGRGKLLNGARSGNRPKLDPRNQLILHALDFAREFSPRLIVFENVPEMENTVITNRSGELQGVLDVLKDELEPEYGGSWEVVEFADYGVPQRRQRLITVFSRERSTQEIFRRRGTALPMRTHSSSPVGSQLPWVTVEAALADMPPLDAGTAKTAKSGVPYHRVPVLDADKYFWVSNTPPGRGAFDNQCVNLDCGFQGNTTHGSTHNARGINKANTDTPIHCQRCGELLPRPWVVESGRHRLMKGFASAYKRMRGDLPASALTRNLSYACSDHKLHPTEHRVLSLHEAFILHTVSKYRFDWSRHDGKRLSDKTIREIVGESIPPLGLQVIFDHLASLLRGEVTLDSKDLGEAGHPSAQHSQRRFAGSSAVGRELWRAVDFERGHARGEGESDAPEGRLCDLSANDSHFRTPPLAEALH
ncbi:MAG TPA: DNA cytosine methyltransferase [Phycisphaerae bacterium]|nr:DNA cytosine methyltransferase [Phycisphaerae bacterium]